MSQILREAFASASTDHLEGVEISTPGLDPIRIVAAEQDVDGYTAGGFEPQWPAIDERADFAFAISISGLGFEHHQRIEAALKSGETTTVTLRAWSTSETPEQGKSVSAHVVRIQRSADTINLQCSLANVLDQPFCTRHFNIKDFPGLRWV